MLNISNENNEKTVNTNNKAIHKDSVKRTHVKAILWRIISVIFTIILATWLYSDAGLATIFSVVDNIIKHILFIIFERLFNRWTWGFIHK